jgi:hypothetical protein
MTEGQQLKPSAGPDQPGPEHHDQKGRFVSGNPGNKKAPGRPPGRPNFWTELKRAVKKYRTPAGETYFEALVDRSLVAPRLAEKLVDKLFEDATVPKGIDHTMIQGAGQLEGVVKDLAAAREARKLEAGKPRFDFDEENEP